MGAVPVKSARHDRHARTQRRVQPGNGSITKEAVAFVIGSDEATADIAADLQASDHCIGSAELQHRVDGLGPFLDLVDFVRSEAAIRKLDRRYAWDLAVAIADRNELSDAGQLAG